MIKNVILMWDRVLVAWEPVEAMRALGWMKGLVRAVADATVHTSDWARRTGEPCPMRNFSQALSEKLRHTKHRSAISGSMWTGRFIRFRMSGNGCGR